MLATFYWQYSQALPWVVALLVAAAGFSVWLYPPQIWQQTGSLRWAMPLLRMTGLAMLTLSILRPVFSRPRNDKERGPVVVLLDNSRSMSVVDTGRPTGQWVAIAAALDRLHGSARDTDLQAMQNQCDHLLPLADDVTRARAERDYARLSGGAIDAASARLDQSIHDLQSAAHDASTKAATFAHNDGLERTLATLTETPTEIDQPGWLDRVGDRARAAAGEAEQARIANDAALYHSDVSVMDACEPLQSMSRFGLSATAVSDSAAGLLSQVHSTVPAVIYTIGEQPAPISIDALRAASSQRSLPVDGNDTNLAGGIRAVMSSLSGQPVRAVVLFSDGRQVEADSMPPSLANGVPIFTIAAAARAGLKDITLTEVSAPTGAFVGDAINVHVVVRGIGLAGQSTVITLDDGATQQSRAVKFPDDRAMPVDFNWVPRSGGAKRLSIDAANLPGEISLANNHVERWVKIFDRKCRVAIVAGNDGQDLQIARRAVSEIPGAELTQLAIGGKGRIPMSPEQIETTDVLLLCGFRPESFDARQWSAITKLVNEKGGSVIVAPGQDGSFGETNPAFSSLMPFARTGPTDWRTWPGDRGGFQLAAAPGVHALDFGDSGDAAWQTLPPLPRYLAIAPIKPGVRPLLIESESGTPVLTESRIGRGRVFCLGTTDTWRWAAGNAEYPDRFWRQLLRYASVDPYESTDGGLSLDSDTVATATGKPVRVRVRVSGGAHDPAAVKVRFRIDGKIFREQSLAATGAKGIGLFETTVSDLPEGDYQVEANAVSGLGHPQISLHVHPSSEAEMVDLSGDEGWLRRLAESSGGQFFRLDQLGQLSERIRDLPVDLTHPVELPVWDGAYLYLLVLGCFTAEWGLRKRFGLA